MLLSFTDINECSDEDTRCDANALCDNTAGSFMCTCKDGFSGNGGQCYGKEFCYISFRYINQHHSPVEFHEYMEFVLP